jgi:hypothetical protein
MKYTIGWLDATLIENYKQEKKFLKHYKDNGISVDIIKNDGEWWDYEAFHDFEAKTLDEARKYTEEYVIKPFRLDNCEIFSLFHGNKILMTEEDL